MADTARRHAALVEVTLEAEQVPVPGDELDSHAVDLIVGTSLITGPISVALASKLLDMSEPEILELGDTLVEQSWLSQERGGYSSVAGRSSDTGDARIGYVADRLATDLEEVGGKPAVIGELRLSAGQPSAAFPLLAEAAWDAESRQGVASHLWSVSPLGREDGMGQDTSGEGEHPSGAPSMRSTRRPGTSCGRRGPRGASQPRPPWVEPSLETKLQTKPRQ